MTLESIRRSPLTQIGVLGALTLALQIPILLIWGLVGERERTRSQAVSEIADSWGREQNVVGPLLVVPFTYRTLHLDKGKLIRDEAVSDPHIAGSIGEEVRA